jgi:hypothetical protein
VGRYCQTGKDFVRVILDALAKAKADNDASDESDDAKQALAAFTEHAKNCPDCAAHSPLITLPDETDFPRPASVNPPQK